MEKKNLENTEAAVNGSFEEMNNIVDNVINSETTEETQAPEVDETETTETTEETQAPEVDETETTETPTETKPEDSKEESKENSEFDEESEEESDAQLEEIKKHLKSVNNYGYLNCGRHLKNEINAKSLKLFYDEFITYGISSVSDATTIKSIEAYLKSVK